MDLPHGDRTVAGGGLLLLTVLRSLFLIDGIPSWDNPAFVYHLGDFVTRDAGFFQEVVDWFLRGRHLRGDCCNDFTSFIEVNRHTF